VPNIGTYDAGMVVDEDMTRSCIAARGWRPVMSSAPESPPPTPAPRTSTQAATSTPAPGNPAPSTVQPDERARTERLQRFAREMLAKPYTREPFACTDSGWVGAKGYVVDLATWGEAAGLRRGDRVVEIGGVSLARYDSESEAWSKVSRGDNVTVRVDRAGRDMSIQVPCRDDAEAWRSRVAVLQAIGDGQWQTCTDKIQDYIRITRVTSAGLLRMGWECMRERGKAAGQRLPDQYWRTMHAWASKAIEEARYRPTGLSDNRSQLLDAADVLAKAGWPALADDIKTQIGAFTQAPSRP
jgi:hypothetical protein